MYVVYQDDVSMTNLSSLISISTKYFTIHNYQGRTEHKSYIECTLYILCSIYFILGCTISLTISNMINLIVSYLF